MKKKILLRFLMIGALHAFLYLWLVPFVIYPKFGHNGFMFTIVVAVLISLSIIATLFMGKKRKYNLNSDIAANNDSDAKNFRKMFKNMRNQEK